MAVSPAQSILRFGLFELDLGAGQLSRQGARLRLPQQPFQLLSILLERPGEILTRDELRQRLWASDVFVDFDHGLNKSIQKLRDALGDSAASPRYIETIPRVGYRFIAPVSNGHKPSAVIVEPAAEPAAAPPVAPAMAQSSPRWWILMVAVAAVCVLAGLYLSWRPHPTVVSYTRLTDFTDSAGGPALSPDGKLLAFFRGGGSFFSANPVYVKMLPDGEPRLLTTDGRLKYGLTFSPDGTQITYSVIEGDSFATVAISALGGNPHLFLSNAAGLTWLDANKILFSRVRSGLHMGIVTAKVNGDGVRELYYPQHERAMAHYAYASPDRTSALVVEMDSHGDWDQCQLISLNSSAQPRPVGPVGGCTAAGWAPDGSWMYFIATVDRQSHLWRQRFPDGQPQQITSGPTEDEGLAVEKDGHSIITAMGVHESALWLHDERGERSLSSEGEIVNNPTPPVFSADDQFLYYLTLHQETESTPELRRLSLSTGNSEPVLAGTRMSAYDVSPDGKRVVYSTLNEDRTSHIWIAPIDRSTQAKQIGIGNERWPHFGREGEIVFLAVEGDTSYLERMNDDGSHRAKVMSYPIHELQSVSPSRNWVTAAVIHPVGKIDKPVLMAIPLAGGELRTLCQSYCMTSWASSGRFLYIAVKADTTASPGRSLALPLGPGETLPPLPAEGVGPGADVSVVPGAQSVNRADLVGGKDPSHYAYVKSAVHHNLYRVTIP